MTVTQSNGHAARGLRLSRRQFRSFFASKITHLKIVTHVGFGSEAIDLHQHLLPFIKIIPTRPKKPLTRMTQFIE